MVMTTDLPELDLHQFERGGAAAEHFVERLRDVVHTIGFFQLVGHGVPDQLLAQAPAVAERFFALPAADRHEIDNVKSAQFRGYTRFGHEHTNGRPDLRDQIDIGRELPPPALGPDDAAWLRLRGPNLWPTALPELRPTMTEWMEHLERVGGVLLTAMSRALGQRSDLFVDAVSPAEVLLKVIRYRTPADAHVDSRQGVGAHRDTGFVTFVYQHRVGGLQVERDGEFVDVPVRPDAFVVNIGEMFQLVTRGYFKATVHRVVSPPPGVLLQPSPRDHTGADRPAAGAGRAGHGRRERRPRQPDPRQLRRQLAQGATARPPRCGGGPPRRPRGVGPLGGRRGGRGRRGRGRHTRYSFLT